MSLPSPMYSMPSFDGQSIVQARLKNQEQSVPGAGSFNSPSPWRERAGVRGNASHQQRFPGRERPHPNPLPEGEGIYPRQLKDPGSQGMCKVLSPAMGRGRRWELRIMRSLPRPALLHSAPLPPPPPHHPHPYHLHQGRFPGSLWAVSGGSPIIISVNWPGSVST